VLLTWGDGTWYFSVEWLPDGSTRFLETGEVDVSDPVPTDGPVLWHRLHLGRERGYHTEEHDGFAGYLLTEQ